MVNVTRNIEGDRFQNPYLLVCYVPLRQLVTSRNHQQCQPYIFSLFQFFSDYAQKSPSAVDFFDIDDAAEEEKVNIIFTKAHITIITNVF